MKSETILANAEAYADKGAGPGRRIARGILMSGPVGGGVLAGGFYIGGNAGLASVAAVAAGLSALVGMLISHLRGVHRDCTYRSIVARLPSAGITDDAIIAMAVYEAVASRQMDSSDLVKLLRSVATARREFMDGQPGA